VCVCVCVCVRACVRVHVLLQPYTHVYICECANLCICAAQECTLLAQVRLHMHYLPHI